MPITEELKNVRKFESVGFSHEQSEILAESIEQAQVNSYGGLKEFIRNELDAKIGSSHRELDAKIDSLCHELKQDIKDIHIEISKLETRIMASQKDMLIKIFGIVFGTVGLAVTILKLFP